MQNKTKLVLIFDKIGGKWLLNGHTLKNKAILLSTFINITENLLKPLKDKELIKLNNLLESNQKKYTKLDNDLSLKYKIKKAKNKVKKIKLKIKGSAEDIELFLNTITEKTMEEEVIELISEVLSFKYNISKEDSKNLIKFNYHENKKETTFNPFKDSNEEPVELTTLCSLFSVVHITQDLTDFIPIKDNEPKEVLTSQEILARIKKDHVRRNILLNKLNKAAKNKNLSEK